MTIIARDIIVLLFWQCIYFMGYCLRVERKPLNKKVYNRVFGLCRCGEFLFSAFYERQTLEFFFLALLKNIETESSRMKTFCSKCVCDVLCWSLRSPLTMLFIHVLQYGCLSLAHAAFQNILKGNKAIALLSYGGQLIKGFALCAQDSKGKKRLMELP